MEIVNLILYNMQPRYDMINHLIYSLIVLINESLMMIVAAVYYVDFILFLFLTDTNDIDNTNISTF